MGPFYGKSRVRSRQVDLAHAILVGHRHALLRQPWRHERGLGPTEAAEALLALGVDALGANCGATLDMTLGAAGAMRQATPTTPLIVKPNASKPRLEGDDAVYDATPEAWRRTRGASSRSAQDRGRLLRLDPGAHRGHRSIGPRVR
jgi:methionine synthase I (cobalamin-dependent)